MLSDHERVVLAELERAFEDGTGRPARDGVRSRRGAVAAVGVVASVVSDKDRSRHAAG